LGGVKKNGAWKVEWEMERVVDVKREGKNYHLTSQKTLPKIKNGKR